MRAPHLGAPAKWGHCLFVSALRRSAFHMPHCSCDPPPRDCPSAKKSGTIGIGRIDQLNYLSWHALGGLGWGRDLVPMSDRAMAGVSVFLAGCWLRPTERPHPPAEFDPFPLAMLAAAAFGSVLAVVLCCIHSLKTVSEKPRRRTRRRKRATQNECK